MPLPQNLNVLLGAGVFGIVCAATLYVVEHYRQDRRRHAMAKEVARLDSELSVLRRELDSLLAQQKHKYFYNVFGFKQTELWSLCRASKRVKRNKEVFITSSTTTEDYTSALDVDSSDLEFYDVSDDETVDGNKLDSNLDRIDKTLEEGNTTELGSCVLELENLCMEFPENPQLLWRLGKAHYRLFVKTEQKDHITKGIEACTSALRLKPELANVHKWLAILVGERSQFQPMKEKIHDGHLFKQHVDKAVALNPMDPTLHHMLGRFAYDVAELKWYERKVASALFADPPNGTYAEALEHFLEAEKLSSTEWKANLLYLAKCKVKLGAVEEAVAILEKADKVEPDNGVDDATDVEVKELLSKHRR